MMKKQKPVVLIVDDVLANLALLSRQLRDANYRVLGAESGMRAIEQVRRLKPDIILLDVVMPGLDGFETCRLLKGNPETREVPIIFLTALSETVDKVKGFELGGVDYMTKPVQSAEVLARLKTHLTIVELQRELSQHNQTLEQQVAERTEALAHANQNLQSTNQQLAISNQQLANTNLTLKAEVERRKRSEKEKDNLLGTIRQQSDQLSHLTTLLLDAQQAQRHGLAEGLREQVEKNLAFVTSNLDLIYRHFANQNQTDSTFLHNLKKAQELLAQTQSYLESVEWDTQTAEEIQLRESPLLKLTAREREVLQLIIQGKSSPDIAQLLTITPKTVYTYRARVLKKLGMTDVTELIQFAITHQLSNRQALAVSGKYSAI